ncbi:chromatin protein family [Actinidia rufa]|uniref:Chromatin protein family n=1 Tax=Actinidia rufa TaxID=165716 RepID=A0A7J0E4H9_9ERIC|nr:chromatin protein family [Actinidia rufa]
MAALKELLPPVKSSGSIYYDHSNDPWFKQRFSAAEAELSGAIKANPVPVYLKRAGFKPSKPEDFGDGGAFPEIHYAQYPLGKGRKTDAKPGRTTLPITVDQHGNVTYDAIPPKFKHKRVPKASGSPPVPVMHSPPRPVTVKDQQDWKIPPCISNWKNPKGYTIPLDKRLAADGRGLQEVQINDNFAKLSEALYVAEQKAREAVAMRSKVQKEMMMKEKERKEQELRALAQKARSERGQKDIPRELKEEREERLQREKIREERRRERERERRLEAKDAAVGKKSKITRDRDRDVSEKVALGMASTGAGRSGEVMYDQRLFNQEKGMDSGPKKDVDADTYGGADEQLDKIMKTDRFKPDKAFVGTSEKTGPRDRPVEFEKEAEEADPFGLDQFLTEVKKGKKAMDKVGSGGTMKASAGSSMRDGYEGSGRTRVAFERGR